MIKYVTWFSNGGRHTLSINQNEIEAKGELYIIATPIGNLGDITLRAVELLRSCDYLAVEDSRHSRKLLTHLGIKAKMVSLHEHNERQRAVEIISDCQAGKKIGLISDAGTPLISDPGYFLVREAHKKGVKVSPLPGPCAAIAALSCSGMASDRFVFEGFLPAKELQRKRKLKALVHEARTLIFYESTHRITDCIGSICQIFGQDRNITLAKELTKSYETIWFGEVGQLTGWFEQDLARKKGEFVLIVEGAKVTDDSNQFMDDEELITRLMQYLSIKQASHLAAELTGKRKKHFYQLALELKEKGGGN